MFDWWCVTGRAMANLGIAAAVMRFQKRYSGSNWHIVP